MSRQWAGCDCERADLPNVAAALQADWTSTMTVAGVVDADLRHVWLVLCPFALRVMQGLVKRFVLARIYRRWCGGLSPIHNALLPQRHIQGGAMTAPANADVDERGLPSGPTLSAVSTSRTTWTGARAMLGWNQTLAVSVLLVRLLFWHLLQPVGVILFIFGVSDIVMARGADEASAFFALAMPALLLRELLYVFLLAVSVLRRPALFLVDLRRTWKAGGRDRLHAVLYVLAPALFVADGLLPTRSIIHNALAGYELFGAGILLLTGLRTEETVVFCSAAAWLFVSYVAQRSFMVIDARARSAKWREWVMGLAMSEGMASVMLLAALGM